MGRKTKVKDISTTVKIELKDITREYLGAVNIYSGKLYVDKRSYGNFRAEATNTKHLLDKVIRREVLRY